jgi:hypothetical protein
MPKGPLFLRYATDWDSLNFGLDRNMGFGIYTWNGHDIYKNGNEKTMYIPL